MREEPLLGVEREGKGVVITLDFPVDPYYLPPHTFVQLSDEAILRYQLHFKAVEKLFGYPIKKYVVVS